VHTVQFLSPMVAKVRLSIVLRRVSKQEQVHSVAS
jgi:hypothetical protein